MPEPGLAVTWCTWRPLRSSSRSRSSAKRRTDKLPGQSAGSQDAGRPGSAYGMIRQASTHPIQLANAWRGVKRSVPNDPYADRKL